MKIIKLLIVSKFELAVWIGVVEALTSANPDPSTIVKVWGLLLSCSFNIPLGNGYPHEPIMETLALWFKNQAIQRVGKHQGDIWCNMV